jgi:hypothetical protein
MALQEAEYDMTEMAASHMNGINHYGPQDGDQKLAVRFTMRPKQNMHRSKEEGRPIFEEQEYVEIAVPGNKDSVVIRPATERDITRFPKHYEAFKARTDQDVLDGTPLSAWPMVTRAQVEEMAFFKVRTVEQLAQMSDGDSQKFMGLNTLRERARVFLEDADKKKPLMKLQSENEDLRKEMAQMAKNQEALLKKVDALTTLKVKPDLD